MNKTIIRIDLSGVNCYLVKSDEQFILFDTGGPTYVDRKDNNRQEELVIELEKAGCLPGNLKLVVLTHGDIDHVFNAAYIRDKYNAKIALHYEDLAFVENPSIHTIFASSNYESVLMRCLSKIMKGPMIKFSQKALAGFRKFSPDILIDEKFCLSELGLEADILHIPGHTNGSVCALFKDGSLICGDTFANIFKPGIAINALDYEILYKSIEQLKNHYITTVYPGHGKPFEFQRVSV